MTFYVFLSCCTRFPEQCRTSNVPAERIPLAFRNGGEGRKTGMMPWNDATAGMSKSVSILSSRLDTIPALDRQTDRQNW